jgi:hypothetical protein
MTYFSLFDWPLSGSSLVYIKEKIISAQGRFFTNAKYSDHIKIIIPKSGVILR